MEDLNRQCRSLQPRATLCRDVSGEDDEDFIRDFKGAIHLKLMPILEDLSIFADRPDLPHAYVRPLKLYIWLARFMSNNLTGDGWRSFSSWISGGAIGRAMVGLLSILLLMASLYQYAIGDITAGILREWIFIERSLPNKARTAGQFLSMYRFPHTNFILLWTFMVKRQCILQIALTGTGVLPAFVKSTRYLYHDRSYQIRIGAYNLLAQFVLSFSSSTWLTLESLRRDPASFFEALASFLEVATAFLKVISCGSIDFTSQTCTHRLKNWARLREWGSCLTETYRDEAEKLYEWLGVVIDAFHELSESYTWDTENPRISRNMILQVAAFKGFLSVLDAILSSGVRPERRRKRERYARGPKLPVYLFGVTIIVFNCIAYWPFPVTFVTVAFGSAYILAMLTQELLSSFRSLTEMLLAVSFFVSGNILSVLFVGIPAFITWVLKREDVMSHPAFIGVILPIHIILNVTIADEPAFWIVRASMRRGWIPKKKPPSTERRQLLVNLKDR